MQQTNFVVRSILCRNRTHTIWFTHHIANRYLNNAQVWVHVSLVFNSYAWNDAKSLLTKFAKSECQWVYSSEEKNPATLRHNNLHLWIWLCFEHINIVCVGFFPFNFGICHRRILILLRNGSFINRPRAAIAAVNRWRDNRKWKKHSEESASEFMLQTNDFASVGEQLYYTSHH